MSTVPFTFPRPKVGDSTLEVTPFCLGGNVFGRPDAADIDQSRAVLDRFLEAGGNFIDTANIYAKGASERIIGDWIRDRGNRSEVVVATKVGYFSGLGKAAITEHVHISLERLQTDYIDLYYAHVDDHETPLEETLEAFHALIQSGKVRAIAASNYSAARLHEAHDIAIVHGWSPYIALQPHYNLVHRAEFEQELAKDCTREHLAVFPYFALANGYLTGKYRLGQPPAETFRASSASEYVNADGEAVIVALEDIATQHQMSIGAVALAWLRMQPGVTAPIASARSVEQLNELLPSIEMVLTAEEGARLTTISAPFATQ